MSNIGPYVDCFAYNKPGETVFFCVSCAKEKSDNPVEEYMVIMYDDMEDMDYLACDSCGEAIRDYRG